MEFQLAIASLQFSFISLHPCQCSFECVIFSFVLFNVFLLIFNLFLANLLIVLRVFKDKIKSSQNIIDFQMDFNVREWFDACFF